MKLIPVKHFARLRRFIWRNTGRLPVVAAAVLVYVMIESSKDKPKEGKA
jgi:hypothetical protein